MKDFSIYAFNPQPEPPGQLHHSDNGRATYYQYELKNVQITSFQLGGG